MRRSVDIQNWHDLNMERRAEHREKLEDMKAMIQTQNKWVYDNIRRQKEINESLVKKERSK